MAPLIVLLLTFAIAVVAIRLFRKQYDLPLAARIALSVMLLFTSIGHFLYHEGMVLMMPDFIPFKKELVYFTGLIEIAAAAGLQVPRTRKWTGWLLILFFILVLSANINAAIKHVDYQRATYEGMGPEYLWFRVPLQLFFIVWTYFCAVKFGFRGSSVMDHSTRVANLR